MPDILLIEPVNISDALHFLWKFRCAVAAAEFELGRMIEHRRELPLPGRATPLPPLIKDDPHQDSVDEAIADDTFLEIKDMLDTFLQQYSGVEINIKP